VESFVAAAEILKERGAYKIFVMATHGLLSADAPRLIEESAIDEVGINLDCRGRRGCGVWIDLGSKKQKLRFYPCQLCGACEVITWDAFISGSS